MDKRELVGKLIRLASSINADSGLARQYENDLKVNIEFLRKYLREFYVKLNNGFANDDTLAIYEMIVDMFEEIDDNLHSLYANSQGSDVEHWSYVKEEFEKKKKQLSEAYKNRIKKVRLELLNISKVVKDIERRIE